MKFFNAQNLTILKQNISWGGNSTTPPSDTPACGFNNEWCPTVIPPLLDSGMLLYCLVFLVNFFFFVSFTNTNELIEVECCASRQFVNFVFIFIYLSKTVYISQQRANLFTFFKKYFIK